MHITRKLKIYRHISLIFLSIFLFANCSSSKSDQEIQSILNNTTIKDALNEDETFAIGVTSVKENLPLLFANNSSRKENSSLFSKAGLSLSIDEDRPSALIEKLVEKRLDTIIMPLHEFLNHKPLPSEPSLTIYLLTAYSTGYHAFYADKTIKSANDLVGKKIGVLQGSSEELLATFYLLRNNVTIDSVKWMGSEKKKQQMEKLESGEIDAVAITGIASSSINPLISTKDATRLIPYVAIAREESLIASKKKIELFAKTLLNANQEIEKKTTDISQLTHSQLQETDSLEKLLKCFSFATAHDNRVFFNFSEKERCNINTLINFSALLPKQFHINRTKTHISLYTPFVVNGITKKEGNYKHSTYPKKRQEPAQLLFSVPLTYTLHAVDLSTNEENTLEQIKKLAYYFPTATLRLRYVPQKNESGRYAIEERIRRLTKKLYTLFKKSDYFSLETDYGTMSAIFGNRYSGEYAKESTIMVDFLAVEKKQ